MIIEQLTKIHKAITINQDVRFNSKPCLSISVTNKLVRLSIPNENNLFFELKTLKSNQFTINGERVK